MAKDDKPKVAKVPTSRNTSPLLLTDEARAAMIEKVMQLRIAGATYQQIVDQCGISKGEAWNLAQEGLEEARKQNRATAEQLRTVIATRLDTCLNAVWARAQKGDPKAVDRVLAIERDRAKLFGVHLDPDEAAGKPESPAVGVMAPLFRVMTASDIATIKAEMDRNRMDAE